VGGLSANSSRSSSPNTVRSHENFSYGNRFAAQPGNVLHTDASVSSAQSSLDGMFDPDIFLDRLGFIDLDPPLPHEIRLGPLAAPDGKMSSGLTPVNERLSEETLDDCHAFQDLYCPRAAARAGLGVASGTDQESGNFSSNVSMPSMAHSSMSGVGSVGSLGSVGMGSLDGSGNAVSGGGGGSTSLKGRQSREGSITGASVLEGDASVILETLDEVEDEEELGLED